MPFNPTLPANHAPVVSQELRNQFNGLADLVNDCANGIVPMDPVQFFDGDATDDKLQRLADKLNELIGALGRFDSPQGAHAAANTLGWTVTTQPPQFLIELCNSIPPQPESQCFVGGDQRVYAGVSVLWARVTSADAGGKPLSSPSQWIYFPENL